MLSLIKKYRDKCGVSELSCRFFIFGRGDGLVGRYIKSLR